MQKKTPRLLVVLIALVSLTQPAAGQRTTTLDGGALYAAACANCHGADGRGQSPARESIEDALPDFTDCSFATREVAADWESVVHEGGPLRGLSRMMPAFGDALSDEQITSVVQYVRSLCREKRWPRGELNMPRAMFTEKAYPEDEAVLTTTFETGSVLNVLSYERRLGALTQAELSIPFGMQRRPDTGWSGALLGDIALSVKQTVAHSQTHGSILSLAAEAKLATGDYVHGIGSGTHAIESFIAYGQLLPGDAFLHVQAGGEVPFRGARGEKQMFARAALGRTWTNGPYGRSWTPMVELLSAREIEADAPTEIDIVPQLQISLNKRQHILASGGVRLPVTERSRRTQFTLYILWDWFDGGFFAGW